MSSQLTQLNFAERSTKLNGVLTMDYLFQFSTLPLNPGAYRYYSQLSLLEFNKQTCLVATSKKDQSCQDLTVSLSLNSVKHAVHGTNRVTNILPSDVCKNRVPNDGYQSSKRRSMPSTARARSWQTDLGFGSRAMAL